MIGAAFQQVMTYIQLLIRPPYPHLHGTRVLLDEVHVGALIRSHRGALEQIIEQLDDILRAGEADDGKREGVDRDGCKRVSTGMDADAGRARDKEKMQFGTVFCCIVGCGCLLLA